MSENFTFTIQGADMLRMIKNATVFACKDDTLPSICALHVELDGDTVTVTATDRYVLSQETAAAAEGSADGAGSFLLSTDDAKAMLRVKGWDSIMPVTVTYDAGSGKVTFDLAGGAAGTQVYPTVAGEFPRVRHLLEIKPADEVPAVIGFNPEYLAKFGKVRVAEWRPRSYNATPMVMTMTAPHRPVMVKIGESFRGMIMPVRVTE